MSVPPLLSFCSIASPRTTFEEDVELAVKYGFAGLSVAEVKLDDPAADDRRSRLLDDSGLRASACMPFSVSPLPVPAAAGFSPGQDPEELIRGMRSSVERLAKFDPYGVAVCTGAANDMGPAEQRSKAVEGIREAARTAARSEMRISIEILRLEEFSLVHDLPQAIQLIEDIGESNVDIAYDVWHLWDSPDIVTMSERYAKQIGTVHVNDWLADPPGEYDRGWAGEGVAETPAMFAALVRGGFDGWYDVEVFKGEFETTAPEKLFERARESWDQTWKAVEALV